jgi:Fe-S-cluster containining protein|tara:strand:+ start:9131 stop:9769 length:639 start_codon:yes stop_codon:yes gene_type:complete
VAVNYTDSVGKILGYLKNSSADVTLSRLFFRDFSCPAKCGGCCLKFSLDYFEGERWEKFKELYPEQVHRFEKREVNGVPVWTDWQKDNETRWCRHLNLEDGRCGVHKSNPFSCEFELIKLMDKSGKTTLIKKLFGRGWGFKRVDGGKGALCEMLPFNSDKVERDVELLEELADYGDRFGIKTKLKRVVSFLRRNIEQLKLGRVPKKEMRFFG